MRNRRKKREAAKMTEGFHRELHDSRVTDGETSKMLERLILRESVVKGEEPEALVDETDLPKIPSPILEEMPLPGTEQSASQLLLDKAKLDLWVEPPVEEATPVEVRKEAEVHPSPKLSKPGDLPSTEVQQFWADLKVREKAKIKKASKEPKMGTWDDGEQEEELVIVPKAPVRKRKKMVVKESEGEA
jgi:hypothetical protein